MKKLREYLHSWHTNCGTVSNKDGEFTFKINKALQVSEIEIPHIGYLNTLVPINSKNQLRETVWLEPNYNTLNKEIVRYGDPRHIVEEAMRKIG